jgi:hypothetical protein
MSTTRTNMRENVGILAGHNSPKVGMKMVWIQIKFECFIQISTFFYEYEFRFEYTRINSSNSNSHSDIYSICAIAILHLFVAGFRRTNILKG